jgi:YbbR domain-containing protein
VRRRPRFPGTAVVSVILACLLWYGTALERRERISERQVDASLTLVNVPTQLVVASDVPRTLTLRLRGPLRRLRELDPSQVGVVIDLHGAGEGEHEFAVETGDVVVPDGVQVLAVSPPEVPLRLDRLVRRRIPVRPRVVGEPAEGYEVESVQVDPSSAIVSGPRLQLEGLPGVLADPVDVGGAEGPIDRIVALRAPGPLSHVEEPLDVRVVVQIVPVKTEVKGGRGR